MAMAVPPLPPPATTETSETEQVFPEGFVLVFGARQASALQGGDQAVGDFDDLAAGQGVLEQEAVAADFFHGLGHLDGDAIRGADEVQASAAGIQQHVSQCLGALAVQIGFE